MSDSLFVSGDEGWGQPCFVVVNFAEEGRISAGNDIYPISSVVKGDCRKVSETMFVESVCEYRMRVLD